MSMMTECPNSISEMCVPKPVMIGTSPIWQEKNKFTVVLFAATDTSKCIQIKIVFTEYFKCVKKSVTRLAKQNILYVEGMFFLCNIKDKGLCFLNLIFIFS